MASIKFPLETATDVFWEIERCVDDRVDPRGPDIPSHLPENPGIFYTTMTYQRKHNPHKLWINRKTVEKKPRNKMKVAVMGAILTTKLMGSSSDSTLASRETTQIPMPMKLPPIKHKTVQPEVTDNVSEYSLLQDESSSSLGDNTEMTFSSSEEDEPLEKDENLKTYSNNQLYYRIVSDKIGAHPIRSVHRKIDNYHLDLRYINISHLEFRAICITLMSCPLITRLDLTEVFIDDIKAAYLTDLFKENHFLTDLILKGCKLGYRQMKRILDTQQHRDTLAYLDVSGNQLKDDSALLLAKYIEGSAALIYLIMSSNAFGETAGRYFGSAISDNLSLRYLDLSKNNIRRGGAYYLMNGIGRNHSLDTIDVSWNALREDGVRFVRKVLDNPELRRIDLTGTGMNTVCMQHIAASLKKNTTLEYIGLRNNPCLIEDYTSVLEAVSQNSDSRLMQIDLGNQTLCEKAYNIAKELKQNRLVDILFGTQLKGRGFVLGDQVAMMKINMASDAIHRLKPEKRVAIANYFRSIDQNPDECVEPLHRKKTDRDCMFNAQAERGVISYRAFALRLMMIGDNPERIIEETEKHLVAPVPSTNVSVIRSEPDFFVVRDMDLKTAFRAEMDDRAASVAKEPEVVQFT